MCGTCIITLHCIYLHKINSNSLHKSYAGWELEATLCRVNFMYENSSIKIVLQILFILNDIYNDFNLNW